MESSESEINEFEQLPVTSSKRERTVWHTVRMFDGAHKHTLESVKLHYGYTLIQSVQSLNTR